LSQPTPIRTTLDPEEFFLPPSLGGVTFDEKSVPLWTRRDFRGVLGVTHNLVWVVDRGTHPGASRHPSVGGDFQRRLLMHMKKALLPTFLATCLSVGAGFPGDVAAAVVRETEHGVKKTGRAVAKAGEVSGKAIAKAGEKTGKASETVAKVTARGTVKAGKEIGKTAEGVGRESGKAGEEVAKGAEWVGKGTVKVVEKIGGKSQKLA
jgi:hypothetical protein